MTTSNVIEIKGGRHLLQECVVPAFVANDCFLAGGRGGERQESSPGSLHQEEAVAPSLLILTGPNHSGKSVYIKQVALIVYLAHMGSFVPADRATIGIVDRILTRVRTRESAARVESAFAIDMRQVFFAINLATRRSLILIDEFGKGTSPTDGAALAAALFAYFANKGQDERPKVLAATHFHEIFENRNSFLGEVDNHHRIGGKDTIGFAHMDINVNKERENPEEQVTFLYHLVPGRSTASFGCMCAAINGIDGKVVERAEALGLLMARGEDLSAACLVLSEEETEELADAEAIAREFVRADIPDFGCSGRVRADGRTQYEMGEPDESCCRELLRRILGRTDSFC